MKNPLRNLHLLPFALLACLLASQPAAAQSDNDLRRENQRLNTQLRETTAELEAARARIAQLEQQVARLERALAAASGSPAPTTPSTQDEVTIDETEPTASPRALLRTLKEEYEQAMEEQEIGREGDRTRAHYMRNLQRWQAAMTRKYRSQVQWHVQVEDAASTRSGYDLKVRAVDPVTHVQLGPAFDVSLPRNLARRYEALRSREAEVFVLSGTLIPRITINANRHAAGPFDNPPLIGPFAEFQFSVDPRSLVAATDEE